MVKQAGMHVAAIAACAVLWCSAQAAERSMALPGKQVSGRVSVMTQNLYIGTDILELAGAESLCQLFDSANEAVEQVLDNDFRQRALAVADLIDRSRPHVVGLQEAFEIRLTDLFLNEYYFDDYIALLLDALDGRYYLGARRSSSELEIPFNRFGDCDPDNPLASLDARAFVTDQDAILCRTDVVCGDGVSATFETNTIADVPEGEIEIERGWVAVTAEVKGRPYLVFNTHLEVDSTAELQSVQFAQARELAAALNLLKPLDLAQIVVGDFNSDETSAAACPDREYCGTAYQVMLDNGFLDTWSLMSRAGGGATCCQDEDLRNPESALTGRIDQVWIRGATGHRGGAVVRGARPRVLGDEALDRSEPDGLWPSDHAAVFTRLVLGGAEG
jgi:hypothetical protein